MGEGRRFELVADALVEAQLLAIDRRDRSLILDAIETHLAFEANVATRNRKPMRSPNTLGATWELRCGPDNRYRVFYEVDLEARLVVILAIGRKTGNRLLIGGEEFEP